MIEQFDFSVFQKKLKPVSSVPPDWKRLWNGNFKSTKFSTSRFKSLVKEQKKQAKKLHTPSFDVIGESRFEDHCYLSIIKHLKTEEITFVELGAGWGGQLSDADGIVRNRLIDTLVKTVKVFAVEAEPTHFKWLQEVLMFNQIRGTAVFGAVSDKVGFVNFKANEDPGDSYGQAIHSSGNVQVPCYTLDYLVEVFRMDHIHILSMDVQGEELSVFQGSMKSVKKGLIDFVVVGTHREELNAQIKEMLTPYFQCLIDYEPWSGLHELRGFSKQIYIPQDGLQVYARNSL